MEICVVLLFKFTSIVTPNQEFQNNTQNMCPKIRFHVFKIFSYFTLHVRCTFEEKLRLELCSTVQPEKENAKVYSQKEIVLMETYISDFDKQYYIVEIKKLSFHLPYVLVIGTQHQLK